MNAELQACTLLFCGAQRETDWQNAFYRMAPRVRFRGWPDWDPAYQAEFALVWQPPRGELAKQPALKAVFSIGAGVDHLSSDPDLPAKIPVIRMVDPALTSGMSEYVVLQVLYHHRVMATYACQQRQNVWQVHEVVAAGRRTVGVMGAGTLGRDALQKLALFGFNLRALSQSRKQIKGVTHFSGLDQLPDFLRNLDILVCLLPLTRATHGILNHKAFSYLAPGAAVVNAARGEHLVERDLLAALDSGQISAASIDVFEQEPLPSNHAFWRHPRIQLTPHIASMTSPETAVPGVLKQIWNYQNRRPFSNVVDLQRGY